MSSYFCCLYSGEQKGLWSQPFFETKPVKLLEADTAELVSYNVILNVSIITVKIVKVEKIIKFFDKHVITAFIFAYPKSLDFFEKCPHQNYTKNKFLFGFHRFSTKIYFFQA